MEQSPEIITLEEVDSTNNYILKNPSLWERNHCVIRAVAQTAGRGRYGRSWHQNPGLDLAFSMIHLFTESTGHRSLITLRAGLACYRALREITGAGLRLKWPNDLYYEEKKLGGILCEYHHGEKSPLAVIGIGINCDSTEFPEALAGSVTSLKLITGKRHHPEMVMGLIIPELVRLMKAPGSMSDRERKVLKKALHIPGEKIRFIINGSEKTGTITDLSSVGSLSVLHGTEEILLDGGEILA